MSFKKMKILAFTAIRSDYDLMSPLYFLLNQDPEIELKLIVSGAHLSKSYGYSLDEIRKDGFEILLKTETLINSDSKSSRIKSASLFLQNTIDVVSSYDPDLMIYAGDREDALMSSILAGYLEIPSIHFYAGDHVKDGYIDNPVRHAISKISTYQFVSIEEHRKRLLKMGELPERVHVIGNVSLDKFVSFIPSSDQLLVKKFGEYVLEDFALVIFHPVADEREFSAEYFENILQGLKSRGIPAYISYPNVDPGNFGIIERIKVWENEESFMFFRNLGRQEFLSLYKKAKFILGNSSSGICEAASIPIPAINVGLRQVGRYADDNVIFCGTKQSEIEKAVDHVLSEAFQLQLQSVHNSYGAGDSAPKAYNLIKKIDFKSLLSKKEDPLESL